MIHSISLYSSFRQSLDARAFGTVPRLRELDLGQNQLKYIHPDAFAGLPDLRNLYLDDNRYLFLDNSRSLILVTYLADTKKQSFTLGL